VGFIFQFYNLIPLTAFENVELPAPHRASAEREKGTCELALRVVNLEAGWTIAVPTSGGSSNGSPSPGAVVTDSSTLLVADEPTGDLDGSPPRRSWTYGKA